MPARILLLLSEANETMAYLPSGVRAALERIADRGESEAELEASVLETDGVAGLPLLYISLNRLAQRGLLSYRAAGGSGPLATATCTTLIDIRAADPAARYMLSRFALVRRIGERLIIETSLSPARITIDDARLLPFIAALAMPRGMEELTGALSNDEISALISLLLSCQMFADSNENDGSMAYWNFHDLLFHARTRLGRHHGVLGGSFPFRGRTEPLPVAKPEMSDDVVQLDTPILRDGFTTILDGRHTSRVFDDPPITRSQLGEFLYRSARIRNCYDLGTGQQLSKRSYPGGGAVYELEIYASVRACVDLAPGLYHYCPLSHRLCRIADNSEALLRNATQPPHAAPQVLLTIAARFGRIFWKYEAMGYALILKDVGALFQTMYLVAQAMGLGACAIGGGDSDLFAAAAGLDYYAETSVGEIVIGSTTESNKR
ncbi:MAG TPA: SagB family peptide dehydrogenase [Thermoanaerobaculia bacterium]|jgi:SagB-type dehydrogenase family enzyme|nr:SagB family peptide dehydrogenase [Thermoanaerobaculia bacterium]